MTKHKVVWTPRNMKYKLYQKLGLKKLGPFLLRNEVLWGQYGLKILIAVIVALWLSCNEMFGWVEFMVVSGLGKPTSYEERLQRWRDVVTKIDFLWCNAKSENKQKYLGSLSFIVSFVYGPNPGTQQKINALTDYLALNKPDEKNQEKFFRLFFYDTILMYQPFDKDDKMLLILEQNLLAQMFYDDA